MQQNTTAAKTATSIYIVTFFLFFVLITIFIQPVLTKRCTVLYHTVIIKTTYPVYFSVKSRGYDNPAAIAPAANHNYFSVFCSYLASFWESSWIRETYSVLPPYTSLCSCPSLLMHQKTYVSTPPSGISAMLPALYLYCGLRIEMCQVYILSYKHPLFPIFTNHKIWIFKFSE